MVGRFVLGLNQYTHSAAACLLGPEGELVAALEKERITRKKHDGGDTAEVVREILQRAGIERRDLARVVANNHLFRIRDFEAKLPWEVAQNAWAPSYLDPFNLLPGVPRHELSHHLAHAWSVLPVAPFDEGLIVVMDGMGSTRVDVLAADATYTTDSSLPKSRGFTEVIPKTPRGYGFREAESAYLFSGLRLKRVFKRWTVEPSPSLLYNYGFQDMESLGALYSRISSHIFGDWNACGKVMGLAPWHGRLGAKPRSRTALAKWSPFLRGPLAALRVDWERIRALPHPHAWAEVRHRSSYAAMADRIQRDLETVALEFLVGLRKRTKARNLALAGGVALNSTLNGRIVREAGFDQVFIPAYPGDEGVAIGCAWFGFHTQSRARGNAPRRRPLPAALGPIPSDFDFELALERFAPWIEVEAASAAAGESDDAVARALARHEVIGWYDGPTEFGPRALGHRSILAHPGRHATWDRINREIKRRESFRPFAPIVLADRASEYFAVDTPTPFMSLTAEVRRKHRPRLRAITHVDGSARLQTLSRPDNPRLHDLIARFAALTGLPILLNTSFNIGREPIVHSPEDAVKSFLDGGLDLLVLGPYRVRRRPWPPLAALKRLTLNQNPAASASRVLDGRGETTGATLMIEGTMIETDGPMLQLFQRCDGSESASTVIEAESAALGLSKAEVRRRLEQLYDWRAIRLSPR